MRQIWPWPRLTLRDVKGALLLFVFVILLLLGAVFGPEMARRTNYGFGPEWDCVNPGKVSGLTCIKHSPQSLP
jgi:hypothetical protein